MMRSRTTCHEPSNGVFEAHLAPLFHVPARVAWDFVDMRESEVFHSDECISLKIPERQDHF